MESFWTVWKLFGQSGKFLNSLESFQQCEKFPTSLENVHTVLKVSCDVSHYKHGMYAKAIYALLVHSCRKRCLRTFGAFLLLKRSMSQKFLRVIFCHLESFKFGCLWPSQDDQDWHSYQVFGPIIISMITHWWRMWWWALDFSCLLCPSNLKI